jgi:CxxC-x17-CxxC domain-containing protein
MRLVSKQPERFGVLLLFLILNLDIVTTQPSCAEPFRLTVCARKNSKRLLCGLFYDRAKEDLGNERLPLPILFFRRRGRSMLQRRRHGPSHAPKSSHFGHPKCYQVICSGCGKEVITPVLPPDDKKLLCMGCFITSGISKEET